MIQTLLSIFPSMLLGAQLFITLILVRGEICPGQRGRLHKALPTLGILWLAVASLRIEAFMVVFAIFYFFSQVRTGKTRDAGPIWILYLANGLALAFVGIQIGEQSNIAFSLALLANVAFSGAVFTQLLLVIARSRLQAFHRILPVTGVVSGMVMALTVLGFVYGLTDEALKAILPTLLTSLALMITGIVIWCWHLFMDKEVSKGQLGVALGVILISMTSYAGLANL